MSESTRKKIIAGVLVIAIIWGYQNLAPKKGSAPPERPVPTAVRQADAAPAAKQTVAPKLVDVKAMETKPWGTDPFRTTKTAVRGPKAAPRTAWVLSGIIYNNHSPVAIINKKPVRAGQVVDGARVVKIEKKTVTLQHNDKQMTITVSKG